MVCTAWRHATCRQAPTRKLQCCVDEMNVEGLGPGESGNPPGDNHGKIEHWNAGAWRREWFCQAMAFQQRATESCAPGDEGPSARRYLQRE
ncbi:hypothetical protein DEO72_LG7g359 [Vigna unguiculata]|uniref:Uncharacterized protein n=1 Tax=Vigna unguiculata TaxID=3917 RepID=A0A4D6MCG8_VIGUN|nr:hypothetical protein DEO72_LG7g359 [Vigna unguiculata]